MSNAIDALESYAAANGTYKVTGGGWSGNGQTLPTKLGWIDNRCNRNPIDRLNGTYYQLSQPLS